MARIAILSILGTAALLCMGASPSAAARPSFKVGAAKADITGPAAQLGMLGYGDFVQRTRGIHSRLHSRAFVIEPGTSGGAPLAYVVADLCFISQAVSLAVLDRLERSLPGVFSSENVMLTAIHTHAGPGGYSHSTIFNATVLGFSERNFDAIVSGISDSIIAAWRKRVPARLYLQQGLLEGATVNRSLEAHQANGGGGFGPEGGAPSVNDLMTQIRFVAEDGRNIGVLNWFAMHATGMSKRNGLVSSDNKGYAAWKLERELSRESPEVVAAFSNSDEGDVSPDIFGAGWQRRMGDLDAVRTGGEAQASRALELLQDLSHPLEGLLDRRHRWVRMPGLRVPAEPASGLDHGVLCVPAFGHSFAAGAEDGPSGFPGFREGMKQGDGLQALDPLLWLYRLFGFALGASPPEDERCHAPKPILIAAGRQEPAWVPEVLPFQVFRIADFAVIGTPAEITTEAGRRIRREVLSELASHGVTRAVIGGLANTYSSYVTTFEEYQVQSYEGASTLFGPHTLAAYLSIFGELARSMAEALPSPPGDRPVRLSGPFLDLQPGVVFDGRRIGERFGTALVQPRRWVAPGQTAFAAFRTGHPKNDFRTGVGYFELQRFREGTWVPVATEDDPSLVYRWNRTAECLGCSRARIDWSVPFETEPGIYRFVHHGASKEFGGRVRPFSGTTRAFEVRR